MMKRFLIIVSSGCLEDRAPIENFMFTGDEASVREYAEALAQEAEADRAYIFELRDFGMAKVMAWSSDKVAQLKLPSVPVSRKNRAWTQKEALELLEAVARIKQPDNVGSVDWDRLGAALGRTGKAIQNMLWRIETGKIKVEDLPK